MTMANIGDLAKEQFDQIKHQHEEWPTIPTPKAEENCVNCGAKFFWSENQFRRECPGCGIVIERVVGTPGPHSQTCGVCQDGFISYKYQSGGRLYNVAARCLCPLGESQFIEIPNILDALHAPARYQKIFEKFIEKLAAGGPPPGTYHEEED